MPAYQAELDMFSVIMRQFNIRTLIRPLDGVSALTHCEGCPAQEDGVKAIKTACRACIANCGVIATVKNGRVVSLKGNPEDPMSKGRMCAKGLSGIQALYHPNRNKYPMKRVGPRGSGQWKRISWDEALTTIAEKLMETREK
jgi:anaerobic selenocysteine-containing dehydrogenase